MVSESFRKLGMGSAHPNLKTVRQDLDALTPSFNFCFMGKMGGKIDLNCAPTDHSEGWRTNVKGIVGVQASFAHLPLELLLTCDGSVSVKSTFVMFS
jgi:hypothetical protein